MGISHSRELLDWPGQTTQGESIVFLGDSYESYNAVQVSGVNNDFSQSGYFTVANVLLGFPFRVKAQYGVGGETPTQIVARLDRALAEDTDWILIGGGWNGRPTTHATALAMFNVFKPAYDKAIQAGRKLIIRTVPVGTAATTAETIGVHALNAMIRQYAYSNPCLLLDMAALTCDPNTGKFLLSGAYGAPANFDNGSSHLSNTAAAYVGSHFATILAPYCQGGKKHDLGTGGTTAIDRIYDATNGVFNTGNMFANGKLLGTGGTSSDADVTAGGIATSWIVSGNANPGTGGSIAVTKVSRNGPVVRGEWQQIAITGNSTAGFTELGQEMLPGSTIDGTRGINIGDTIHASVEFETDSSGWPTTFSSVPCLELRCYTAAYALTSVARCLPQATPGMIFRMPSGVLRTPDIVIPATTAHIFGYFRLDGGGTIRFAQMQGRVHV